MSQEIQDKLLAFITSSFMVEREEIDLDKSMIDEGIIDSFGLIEIASFMEKEFNMQVREEQMIRSNFGSVHKIVDFIKRETGQ
ncbi:MAG: acyl carrier protein [Desulfobulbaceae bacterium]